MADARASRLVWGVLGVWLLLALALALSGVLERVLPPVFAFGFTGLALAALAFVPALRAWAETVPLRWLVLYHTVRFVGIVFLVGAAQAWLPAGWAVPAGWGDIAVAVLALPVARWACPVTNRGRWWAVVAWNTVGLLDILFVLISAVRLVGVADNPLLPLAQFPLALIPTFLVPLILVTHLLIYWRLAKERAR